MTKSNVAILAVGVGVGGIQPSLDIAATGLDVYLLDKSFAIDGTMAQFAKIPPDYTMCIPPQPIKCALRRVHHGLP